VQRLAAGNEWRDHAALAGGINIEGGKVVHPALQGMA
jgi:alanine dehydrogenase